MSLSLLEAISKMASSQQKQISELKEEVEELKRVNALLIERLTEAMDRIWNLETKDDEYAHALSKTHWDWLWTSPKK